MANTIGIRREDKHRYEARVPLTPDDVRTLTRDFGLRFVVQKSPIRAFPEEEYAEAGAKVAEDLEDCSVILGVKEIPPDVFEPGKTYVFFSHVIKGQPYNMPMLRRAMELGCTIIDYEKVTDDSGRRLIFFGRYAGMAGMIDTLWALGQRLHWKHYPTAFTTVLQAHKYPSLEHVDSALKKVGAHIREDGLRPEVVPLVIGLAGYGNVSQGAQAILDRLEPVTVQPEALPALGKEIPVRRDQVYKVVFEERHMVEPLDPHGTFDLQEYYAHPERYRGTFERYLPYLTVLVNCIYWDARYPRLVTKKYLREALENGTLKLEVIGDISCDIEGAVEATVKTTDPGNPIYVYDPIEDKAIDGYEGRGPVILAVDTLPCELPVDASRDFGKALTPFVPALAQADFSAPWEALDLPPELKRAVIVYQGKLTPDYTYIAQYL